MSKEIILEKNFNQCRTLMLNRPQRLNAFSLELAQALAIACQKAAQDNSVRVLVIRGAEGNFSAGGDLKNFYENIQNAEQGFFQVSEALNQAIESITLMPKPVIAAIEGSAFAAGFGIALSCDILVASESARLSPSFTNIALAPNASTTYLLPRILGPKQAAEAFFTGQIFSAKTAWEKGLVNHIWADSDFEEELQAFITQLEKRPVDAIARIKRLLRHSSQNSFSEQLKMEKEEIAASSKSPDFKEGVTAFIEKRRPNFKTS